jgi:hypothetical protein
MADNSFRANRGRDDIDANSPGSVRDPLAELARLIGQTDTAGDYRTGARREPVQHYEEDVAPVAPAQEWAAEERYDDQHQYAEESYAEPQAAEAYPALRDDYPRFSQQETREPQFDDRYVEPAAEHDSRNAPLAYEDQYQDEPPPPSLPRNRQLPTLAPEARDIGAHEPEDGYADPDDQGYQDDDGQWHEGADGQGYAAEEYDDEAATAPRRSGLSLFLGVIGLVLIGAASAFAYHSMVGGRSFIPSLPPIIKASDSPNKIVPAPAASAGNAGAGNTNPAEKLVPREEQPVPIQPQNAPPRVVATIPVVPQSAALPAAQSAQGQSVFPAPPAPAAPPAQPAAAGSAEPKKIHTVTIRTNQPPPANIDPVAQSAPATHAPAAIAPKPAPAPRSSANAPLSLVPGSQGSAAPAQPPRTQVARAEPANAPLATTPTGASPAPAGGGYSVQVTSQRSEADAESSYKELQAKYPGQLASHHASIRRADLGEKGTYYRAMVGPFASADAAASMCSSLKAAGGSCIVQRN